MTDGGSSSASWRQMRPPAPPAGRSTRPRSGCPIADRTGDSQPTTLSPTRARVALLLAANARGDRMPTTSEFILNRLTEWGVKRIYGYPGDGINSLLGAFHKTDNKPEFIQCRHEEIA